MTPSDRELEQKIDELLRLSRQQGEQLAALCQAHLALQRSHDALGELFELLARQMVRPS